MYNIVFVLLMALALPAGGAGDRLLDRATLHGVTAVNVVVDPVDPEIQKENVTVNRLQWRLEERLRNAGVRVDPGSTEFVALRLISVRSARSRLAAGGTFAISAAIGLYQPVTLVRDPKVRTATQTWEVETVMLADTRQVEQACMDSVDELADRFVAAYRSVNAAAAP